MWRDRDGEEMKAFFAYLTGKELMPRWAIILSATIIITGGMDGKIWAALLAGLYLAACIFFEYRRWRNVQRQIAAMIGHKPPRQ